MQTQTDQIIEKMVRQLTQRARVIQNIGKTRDCGRQTIQAVASKANDDGSLYYDRSREFRERRITRHSYEWNCIDGLYNTKNYPSERFEEDAQFRAGALEECRTIIESLNTPYADRKQINYILDESKPTKETILELINLHRSRYK